MSRKDKILSVVNLKGAGLELGPLCWPIVSKDEANIEYVDHVSATELKRLYKDDPGVLPELIADVDYPLDGRSLQEAIGQKRFDYIIASHVIEHIPDMVRWLQDLAAILKPGGVVSLAIPDKRYTFDIDRNPSTPSDVIGAYIDSLQRPSSTMVFDFASRYRLNIDAVHAWKGELYLNSRSPNRYSLHRSLEMTKENKQGVKYIDTHCYVFTPRSFFEILRVLIELDLLDFQVASFFDTDFGEYEFVVSLQKAKKSASKRAKLETLPKLSREPYRRELESRIAELENYTQNLHSELLRHKKELDHVLSSKSWQLTKPVRYGIRQAKKFKRR